MPLPIVLKPADQHHDFELARRIHHAAYKDVIIRQFGAWDEHKQDNFFRSGWESAPSQIITLEGEAIGILCVETLSDHIFLLEIQLLPEWQKRGVGSQLIQEQMQRAKQLRLTLRLRVLRLSTAHKLYQRLGFLSTSSTAMHRYMEWIPPRT